MEEMYRTSLEEDLAMLKEGIDNPDVRLCVEYRVSQKEVSPSIDYKLIRHNLRFVDPTTANPLPWV